MQIILVVSYAGFFRVRRAGQRRVMNVRYGSTSDSRDLPLPRLLSGVKQTLFVRGCQDRYRAFGREAHANWWGARDTWL